MKIFTKIGVYLASLLLVGLVCLILTEIAGRYFFDYSTMIADEYSGYLYLALVFLGLGYTFEQEGHIRISIITSRLGKAKNRFIDLVVGVVLLGILLFALYYAYALTYDSYDMEMLSENVSETPIYLTQIPVLVGLGIFVLSVFHFLFKRFKHDV